MLGALYWSKSDEGAKAGNGMEVLVVLDDAELREELWMDRVTVVRRGRGV